MRIAGSQPPTARLVRPATSVVCLADNERRTRRARTVFFDKAHAQLVSSSFWDVASPKTTGTGYRPESIRMYKQKAKGRI